MTSSPTFRALSAALLTAALGLAVLPGCGKPPATQPEKKDEPKKDDPKVDPKKGDPAPDPKKGDPGAPSVPPKSALGKVESDAEGAAEGFLKELMQGTAKADALSAGFLKSVGKPVEPLPDDIKNGFSRDNAARWLRRVGENRNFNPALFRQQAGDVVLWRGFLTGPTLPSGGGYSLRLVKESGAWKVDWLGLSSADNKGSVAPGSADEAFQEFAVAAFVEVLADATAMADETRPAALARALTPDVRKAWAAPGKQDQDQGYDYSPAHLRIAAIKYGGGTKEFTVAKTGDLTFSVVLTKPAGPKTIVVKLVKGATPGEWLVSEVSEAKG